MRVNMLIIWLGTYFFQILSGKDFVQSQVLVSNVSQVHSIDISGDNKLLVIGSTLDGVQVYKLLNNQFVFSHVLPSISNAVYAVDMTADGQWILAIDESGVARVYQYSNSTQNFQEFQVITEANDTSQAKAGALSDDHIWLIFGRDSGNIFIYKFESGTYNEHQTIQHSNIVIRSISMTGDHLFFAVSSVDKFVWIYKFDGTSYNLHQVMGFTSSWERKVSLTNDHQYLSIAGDTDGNHAELYRFDSSTQLFQNIIRILSSTLIVNFMSISENLQWIGVSTGKFQIFRLEGLILTQILAVEESSLFNRFSTNGMFMVASFSNSVRAFINCNYEGTTNVSSYFNHITKLCEPCFTGCLVCESLTQCTECDTGNHYYLVENGSNCLLCDPNAQNYFYNESCTFCPVNDGLHFFSEGQCEKCQIQGCTQCQNLTQCSSCESSIKIYALSEGKCCQLTSQCHPSYWLFLILVVSIPVILISIIIALIIRWLKKRKRTRQPIDIKELSYVNSRQY